MLKTFSANNRPIIHRCIDGILTYWFQSTNSLGKLDVLMVNLWPSLHTCVSDGTSCLSVFIRTFLSHYVQTAASHASHVVAVRADPHVTPAANSPAVQFNQADDMQHGVPLWGVPAPSLMGLWTGGGVGLHRGPLVTSVEAQNKCGCDSVGL